MLYCLDARHHGNKTSTPDSVQKMWLTRDRFNSRVNAKNALVATMSYFSMSKHLEMPAMAGILTLMIMITMSQLPKLLKL